MKIRIIGNYWKTKKSKKPPVPILVIKRHRRYLSKNKNKTITFAEYLQKNFHTIEDTFHHMKIQQ